MTQISCPSCFKSVRKTGVTRFRGFVTCESCGHTFLASIEETTQEPKLTVAIPTEDLAAQNLLQRVQNLDWKGEKPFHGAFLWQISVR